MSNIYRKYAVYDEYGKAAHTVIADTFVVGSNGDLVFAVETNEHFYQVTAFAAGYWSRVELIETIEAVG